MTRQPLLKYASAATALLLMMGFLASPAAADPAVDVYAQGVYTMAVIGGQACTTMEANTVSLPTGQNLLQVEGYLILIIDDGVQTIYDYDQFVWNWENGETECLHSGLWVIWDADASGLGAWLE